MKRQFDPKQVITISDDEEENDDMDVENDVMIRALDETPVVREPNYPVKEKGIVKFNSSRLQKHFSTLIVGRPDSGKSHMIYEFLTNEQMYFKKFNRVIFVSANKKIGGIELDKQPYRLREFCPEAIQQQFDQFNAEVLKKYPSQELFEKRYGKDVDPLNVLLIIDDCVAEIRKMQFHPTVKSIFYNRRHIIDRGCVSVLFTTQYYVEVPRAIRNNLTSLIVFNANMEEWVRMKKEALQNTQKLPAEIDETAAKVFATPRAFIYINIETSQIFESFKNNLAKKSSDDEQIYKKRLLN